jgi:hypothetical protein
MTLSKTKLRIQEKLSLHRGHNSEEVQNIQEVTKNEVHTNSLQTLTSLKIIHRDSLTPTNALIAAKKVIGIQTVPWRIKHRSAKATFYFIFPISHPKVTAVPVANPALSG